jgi:hypothetical protein
MDVIARHRRDGKGKAEKATGIAEDNGKSLKKWLQFSAFWTAEHTRFVVGIPRAYT